MFESGWGMAALIDPGRPKSMGQTAKQCREIRSADDVQLWLPSGGPLCVFVCDTDTTHGRRERVYLSGLLLSDAAAMRG